MDPDTGGDAEPAASTGRAALTVSARSQDGYVIGTLSGELDLSGAPVLREQLLDMLGPATRRLVIDLAAVSFADASGLAVLVGTGRRAAQLGGSMCLAAPTPAVSQVLQITGLDRQLEIFPDVQSAISGQADGPDTQRQGRPPGASRAV
jgi:anti-anti-sigma factor